MNKNKMNKISTYLYKLLDYKYSIYYILDIIIFYSLILLLLSLAYTCIAIITILFISHSSAFALASHEFLFNDITIYYFNPDNYAGDFSSNINTVASPSDINTVAAPTDYNPQSNTQRNVNNKFASYYYNITNKTKRRLYWELIESEKNNYSSYKEFKNNWDPNTKLRTEIKNEIKEDLKVPLHNLYVAKSIATIVVNAFRPSKQR
jgi:hypothetical protein